MHVAMSISRPEDFFFPDLDITPAYFVAHSPWESFPKAMVISGGGFTKNSIGSIKRRFEDLVRTSLDLGATPNKIQRKSHPLAFYKEELPGCAPNASIPLLIRARMDNFDVRRILVDLGSSTDIMYT